MQQIRKRFNKAQDRQQNQDCISSTGFFATHSRVGTSLEKRSKCNLPREMQRTQHAAISSAPFCNQRSRGSKSQEMAMRHKIGSKLRIPSVVRHYATHGRVGESLEKCSKYKLARKMQKTHDFASSSTALCKQRSRDYKSQEIQEMQCVMRDAANSRCCLHQYASPQPTVG